MKLVHSLLPVAALSMIEFKRDILSEAMSVASNFGVGSSDLSSLTSYLTNSRVSSALSELSISTGSSASASSSSSAAGAAEWHNSLMKTGVSVALVGGILALL